MAWIGLAPLHRGCLVAAALLPLGCGRLPRARGGDEAAGGSSGERLPAAERARLDCRASFASCAPPASFDAGTEVDALGIRSLVQISWRLDLPDELCEAAGRRLLLIAERSDRADLEEIAAFAEAAESTLGRCRCKGDRFRPEYEKQRIATVLAGRLPPRELRAPEYWAARLDRQVAALRARSRSAAEAQAFGDAEGAARIAAQIREGERDLCETVQAARDVLQEPALAAMRELVYASRARASGEASAELARGLLDRAEHAASCAVGDPPPQR